MPKVSAAGQLSAASVQNGLAEFPAGSTLLHAKLSVLTSFFSTNPGLAVQYAPPNTVLGISWRPGGTAPELPTDANIGDASWYVAGFGTVLQHQRWFYYDQIGSPGEIYVIEDWTQVLEWSDPAPQAAAYSVGYAMNFLGSGYWQSNVPWLTWQFEATYC